MPIESGNLVIVKLIGGLGNQMFQYAAGRALSLTHDAELKLDISSYGNYKLHNGYELHVLNVAARFAEAKEIAALLGRAPKLARLLDRRFGLGKKTYLLERSYSFDSRISNVALPVYLEGYWQSHKYFEAHANQLRNDFAFNSPISGRNLELAERITDKCSVSVHVRRGDYASNPVTNGVHGTLSVEYYRRAIDYMVERLVSPEFFVFSDDIEWAKKNLSFGKNITFVSHNTGRTSFEDLRLMCLCRHQIIANSSFSWWAAWLNLGSHKIVVAPKRWFRDLSVSTEDLIPGDWTLIDTGAKVK